MGRVGGLVCKLDYEASFVARWAGLPRGWGGSLLGGEFAWGGWVVLMVTDLAKLNRGQIGAWVGLAAQDGFQAVGVQHAKRPGFQLFRGGLAELLVGPVGERAKAKGEQAA